MASKSASAGQSSGRSKGGKARAEKLSLEQRREIAKRGAEARWNKDVPKAVYSGELTIGDMTFPCSVLSDGTRILTQSDFMEGMNMYYSGWVANNRSPENVAAEVPHFLAFKTLKPFVDRHLGDLQSIAVKYRTERGSLAHGIKAEIIPKICDVWIDADDEIRLGSRQKQVAQKARLMMRALAHVGIVALVDEATGYQRDRASDALSQILEAFIAKELQAWVKTFPNEYYEELFRLRGLSYPTDTVKRPQYFGKITNDIVYKRLAPGVLEELRDTVPKTKSGNRKHRFFQKLTPDIGHPKLREHLSSVVTIMKLSDSYTDFQRKLDKIHPKYNETLPLDLDFSEDSGRGL
ncbi:P63C domain-containing protein [Nodosilinea sp. FACHB-13]|uniref:P63C domain-containing protein n=1 Tax=Cyanophyceae TaxID=3028117 RepID=UPI0016854525|nr:P63C domain-containing protein [Nodosilinea sp. FACHB-13]MBD2107282.1 P63C domain-containing protein [Nodosilinea sp. FACHB-13]